ncbi:MAG TPA: iron-sulfur cluster repair di-iron protein [Bacteroidales bacterium]|nr:iron-sulfur cluster repair di-iron protein [Bacteroidales bacterium]
MEKDITIGQIVVRDYRTAAIFRDYDIDFCCGGQRYLSDVCYEKGIDSAELAERLDEVLLKADRPGDDFKELSIDSLCDYIVRVHHGYILKTLPDLRVYTGKIAEVHGGNHKELLEIAEIFSRTGDELLIHLEKEEGIIFPSVKKLSGSDSSGAAVILGKELENLVKEHEDAGSAMAYIRKISGGYFVPEDGCNTWRVAYSMLENFEDDLHMHVHLENNILFPSVSEIIKNIK